MLKNKPEISFPILPLIIYAVLSFSNGIAQIAVDSDISSYEALILKIIEYGIGISVAVSTVWAMLYSIERRNVVGIVSTLIIILFINFLIPIFVKFTFVVIIAIVIIGAVGMFVAPVTSAVIGIIGYLTGNLGPVLLAVFLAAMVFSSYMVGRW